jgi:CheY-like chemotaxis protein
MKTILIVDDDYELAETLSALLRDEGYRVLTSDNGKHGLARLKSERPDLLLTDFMMPSAGGGDLVAGVHESASLQSLPIIMMSASSPSLALADGRVEVAAFLRKPFRCETLVEVVASLIGPGASVGAGRVPLEEGTRESQV